MCGQLEAVWPRPGPVLCHGVNGVRDHRGQGVPCATSQGAWTAGWGVVFLLRQAFHQAARYTRVSNLST